MVHYCLCRWLLWGCVVKILALDIATKTGWSLPDQSGAFDMKPEYDAVPDYGRLTWLFNGWLADMLAEHKPDLVAIESPVIRGSATILLVGLVQTAHCGAYAHQIPRTERTCQAIKTFMAGKHNATKADMINALRARGIEPKSNDEADAIALRLLVEAET